MDAETIKCMPTIGIIDDKKDQRESIQRIIQNDLEARYSEWSCIDTYPFTDREEYVSWIGENDVAVLILDEQLTGEKSSEGTNVDYDGHDLIQFIRKVHPTLPVFGMTAYGANAEELQNEYKNFEDILEDKDFYKKYSDNIDRFIRSGQRFTQTYHEELNKISKVSKAIAEGKEVSQEEFDEVQAIKERLGFPFNIDGMKNRSTALDLMQKQLGDFENLVGEIKNFLK